MTTQDEPTLFAGDTHANPLVMPGSEKARKMTVTSGLKLKGSWLPSGPLGVCLRTLLDTSAWASTKCFLTWRAKATPAKRLLFQLAPSMPHIDAIESGLWLGTPTASMSERSDEFKGTALTPTEFVMENPHQLMPTPTVSSGAQTKENPTPNQTGGTGSKEMMMAAVDAGFSTRKEAEQMMGLKMWPTPSATDGKGSGKTGDLRDRLDYAVERGGTKSKTYDQPKQSGSLNPQWVEWLMGYPVGWTDLKD